MYTSDFMILENHFVTSVCITNEIRLVIPDCKKKPVLLGDTGAKWNISGNALEYGRRLKIFIPEKTIIKNILDRFNRYITQYH